MDFYLNSGIKTLPIYIHLCLHPIPHIYLLQDTGSCGIIADKIIYRNFRIEYGG